MNQSFEKAERIRTCKNRRHVTLVTAYDYPTGRLLDEAGVDIVLVGDSLGMVVLGFPDTTHVTLDHMLHHVEATARGVKNALLVGDMPIHSYDTVEQAVQSAKKLFLAGADAVKLEGGSPGRKYPCYCGCRYSRSGSYRPLTAESAGGGRI